jgi:hypothetical protein
VNVAICGTYRDGPETGWLKCRTAALDLRNLVGRGLTRINRTWVLAT